MPRIAPVLIALALVLTGCRRGDPVPAGDIAGRLTVPTMTGAAFDPATLRGKPALVVFWRPGCPHCLAELPDAQRAAQARGVTAIAVQVSGRPEAGQAALTRLGWNGLALVDDGRLRAELKIRAVPWTLTLRGDGTAREAFVGKRDYATLHAALGRVK